MVFSMPDVVLPIGKHKIHGLCKSLTETKLVLPKEHTEFNAVELAERVH